MTYFKYLILFILSSIFLSCETVVEVDLPQSQQRLVVEGRIEKILDKNSGYQQIRLSLTEDFFNQGLPPAASNAIVSVSDGNGRNWAFEESATEPGLYTTDSLFAEIYMEYMLSVFYNGEHYEAKEKLHAVPPIDSIYQVFVEENEFEDEGIRARIDYRDPVDAENFYLWEQYADGERQLLPDVGNKSNVISSDEFYNGQHISGYEPNEEAVLEPGQTVLVRQLSISKLTYNYYYLLFEQAAGTGLFDPPPAIIRGNVINTTNSENFALGYFGAAEVAERSLLIQPL